MQNNKKRKFTGLVLSVVFMAGVVSSGAALAKARPWHASSSLNEGVDDNETHVSTENSNGNGTQSSLDTHSNEKMTLATTNDDGQSAEIKDRVESEKIENINHNNKASTKTERKDVLSNSYNNKNLWLYGSVGVIAVALMTGAVCSVIKRSREKTKQKSDFLDEENGNLYENDNKKSDNNSGSNLRTYSLVIGISLLLIFAIMCIFYYFMFIREPAKTGNALNLINFENGNIKNKTPVENKNIILINQNEDNTNLKKINNEKDLKKLSKNREERALYTIEVNNVSTLDLLVPKIIKDAAKNGKIKFRDKIVIKLKENIGLLSMGEELFVTKILSKIKANIFGFWVLEKKVNKNEYNFVFLDLISFVSNLVNELNKKNTETFGVDHYYNRDFLKDLARLNSDVTLKFLSSATIQLNNEEKDNEILRALSVASAILGPYGQIINMTLTRNSKDFILKAVDYMEKEIGINKVPPYLKHRLEAIRLYDRVLDKSGYYYKQRGKNNPDVNDILVFLNTLSDIIEEDNDGGFNLEAYLNLLTEIYYYICLNNIIENKNLKVTTDLFIGNILQKINAGYTIKKNFGEKLDKGSMEGEINYLKNFFEDSNSIMSNNIINRKSKI